MGKSNAKNNLRNAGLLAITAGSAIAIVALRDKLFPPTGEFSGKVEIDSLNCFATNPQGFDFDVVCGGTVKITNTGTVPIRVHLEGEVRVSSPGQNETLFPNFPFMEEIVPPGETRITEFVFESHTVESPANLFYKISLKQDDFTFSSDTVELVLSDSGQITQR